MKGRNITTAGIAACSLSALMFIFLKFVDYQALTLSAGVLFVVVGLLDIAFYSTKGREGLAPVMGAVTDMACILLGVCMLVFSREFVIMTTFMLGLAVAIMALWQFFILAIGARPYQLPTWLYIFPVALLGASIYIFVCRQSEYTTPLIITTAVALAIAGTGCLIEGSILGVARRNYNRAQQEAARAAQQSVVDNANSQQTTNSTDTQQSANTATTTSQAQTTVQPPIKTPSNGSFIDFSDIDNTDHDLDEPILPKTERKPIETTDDLDDEIIE